MINHKEYLSKLSKERQDRIRQRANYLILEEKYLRALKKIKELKVQLKEVKPSHCIAPGDIYCSDLNCPKCR